MNRCINNDKLVNIVFSSIDVILYLGKFSNSVDLLTEWEGKMGKYVTQVCRPSATKSACYDCGPNIVQYDTIKLIHLVIYEGSLSFEIVFFNIIRM